MQITSHIHIANFIYNRIDKKERKNISRFMFILGSIAPDLKIAKHPKFKFYNNSIELIQIKMEDLDIVGKRKFSYRLGVMAHYITDYFCLAHNLQNSLKTRTHLLYEFRLARALKKHIVKSDFGMNFKDYSLALLEEHGDILSTIANKHKSYIQGKSDDFMDQMHLDIHSALSVCMALTLFVLK